MDHQAVTTEIYNTHAQAFSTHFSGKGARKEDIERGLSFLTIPQSEAIAVEIGCGDGRDATEIASRVKSYEGFDPSSGLLRIARERVPNTRFTEATALTYPYPKNVDIFFAFASLLHVPKEELRNIFQKIATSLSASGIIYLSLKEADEYVEKIKEDSFGKRMFYYYTPSLITELAGPQFSPIYEDHQCIGDTRWFTMALKVTTQEKSS